MMTISKKKRQEHKERIREKIFLLDCEALFNEINDSHISSMIPHLCEIEKTFGSLRFYVFTFSRYKFKFMKPPDLLGVLLSCGEDLGDSEGGLDTGLQADVKKQMNIESMRFGAIEGSKGVRAIEDLDPIWLTKFKSIPSQLGNKFDRPKNFNY